MTATIVYDKTIFDVDSVGDEGSYKFTVKEDSAAKADDADDDNGGGTKKDDGKMG